MYNPRFLNYEGNVFDGSHHLDGGGKYSLDDTQLDNAYELINEIGFDQQIPLYDKIHIICKMKEQVEKAGKKIIASVNT